MSAGEVWQGIVLNWIPLMAGSLVALTCAYMGVFVVLRRIVFVGLALAQVSGAGVALAFLVGPSLATLAHNYAHSWLLPRLGGVCLEWIAIRPIVMALLLTFLGVWLFARHSWSPTLPRDSVIGAGYVAAYGLTLLFILKSPKGMEDVRELLDGNVLTVMPSDLTVLVGVFGCVFLVHLLLYRQLLFVAFDPEAAAAQGYVVPRWELLFYGTLGVTITVAMLYAGILAVFAYMVIPPLVGLTAGQHMRGVISIAVASALVISVAGFILALRWDLPLSPPTIGVGLGLLALSALGRRISGLRRRHGATTEP